MKIRLTKCWIITKLIYIVYSFYWSWILIAFPQYGGFLIPLGGTLVLVTFLNFYSKGNRIESVLYKPMVYWLLFCLVSGMSSLVVAQNVGEAIGKLMVFIEILAFMFCILAISKMEGSIRFCANTFRMVCLVYAISIVLMGRSIQGRLTLYNSNGDAMICMCGIMLTLLLIDINNKVKTVIRFSEIAYYIFCILQTGSRKALICSIVFLVLWFGITGREVIKNWARLSQGDKNFYILFTVVCIISVFIIAIPTIKNSYAFAKILAGGDEISDGYRVYLYEQAWNVFKAHPIVGVGYYQFIHYTHLGLYTHSTYFELLSCCGLLGTIIYFIPYFYIYRELTYIFRCSLDFEVKKKAIIFIVFFIIMMFLGVGMIHFYNEKFMIVFALMIGFVREIESEKEYV